MDAIDRYNEERIDTNCDRHNSIDSGFYSCSPSPKGDSSSTLYTRVGQEVHSETPLSSRPTLPCPVYCNTVQDTAFDIEQLTKLTKLQLTIVVGVEYQYRQQYHGGHQPKSTNPTIVAPLHDKAYKLPRLKKDLPQERYNLPTIQELFADLLLQWRAK